MSDNGPRILGSAVGGLGASLAAVFATLCCAGPAAVALLGVGGALAAARLGPYRTVLLILSAALVSYGLWLSYGRAILAPGRSCPGRVGGVTRTVLWIAVTVWLAGAFSTARYGS